MKNTIIISLLALSAFSANASSYKCKFTTQEGSHSRSVEFEFDTLNEDNKMFELAPDIVGSCAVLRVPQTLITCGVGNINGQFPSYFTTADIGTSVLGLDIALHDVSSNLICLKEKH